MGINKAEIALYNGITCLDGRITLESVVLVPHSSRGSRKLWRLSFDVSGQRVKGCCLVRLIKKATFIPLSFWKGVRHALR